MSVKSICSNALFSASVSLLIFCVVNLSFGVSGMLKSPKINALCTIYPFNSISVCFTYVGAPGWVHRFYNGYILLLD